MTASLHPPECVHEVLLASQIHCLRVAKDSNPDHLLATEDATTKNILALWAGKNPRWREPLFDDQLPPRPILCFLQNMWVHNRARVLEMIRRHGPEFRLNFMRRSLFRGCKTGRVLRQVFGPVLLNEITFEETTMDIADNPRTLLPVQPDHIRAALALHQPGVVLTLGMIARDAVKPFLTVRHVHGLHPASRHSDTIPSLKRTAAELHLALVEIRASPAG